MIIRGHNIGKVGQKWDRWMHNAKKFDNCGGEIWKVMVTDVKLDNKELVYTISINIVNNKTNEDYTISRLFLTDDYMKEYNKSKEHAINALMKDIHHLGSGEGILWLYGLNNH